MKKLITVLSVGFLVAALHNQPAQAYAFMPTWNDLDTFTDFIQAFVGVKKDQNLSRDMDNDEILTSQPIETWISHELRHQDSMLYVLARDIWPWYRVDQETGELISYASFPTVTLDRQEIRKLSATGGVGISGALRMRRVTPSALDGMVDLFGEMNTRALLKSVFGGEDDDILPLRQSFSQSDSRLSESVLLNTAFVVN